MKTSENITIYQKACWKSYQSDVGILEGYSYLYGNPVKVHVPMDTACNGIMIIGAYPTAHFNTIGSERDVPVGDHLYPFSSEKYFDGSSVREVDSGKELEDLFLEPLQIHRSQTWITDLVKVFLFKEGHQEKYARLGFNGSLVGRNQFMELAHNSKSFIDQEIEICKPKVILGLGAEVNAVMLNKSITAATDIIALCQMQKYVVKDREYAYYACPHPGKLMREQGEDQKWKGILKQILEKVRELI